MRAPASRLAIKRDAPPVGVVGRPCVAVAGTGAVSLSVARSLKKDGFNVLQVANVQKVTDSLPEDTIALLLCSDRAEATLLKAARRARREQPHLPLFVVAQAATQTTLEKLYSAGAEAFFFWPTDKKAIARSLFRLRSDKKHFEANKSSKEIALEELVSASLRADSVHLGTEVLVRAVNRFVVLVGEVDALWKVAAAEKIAMEVQGVEEVFTEDLGVTTKAKNSAKVSAKVIRDLLGHTDGIDANNVEIKVKDGVVTLKGTVCGPNDLKRAKEVLGHLRGVQKVDTRGVSVKKQRRSQKKICETVRRAISLRFPKSKVDVTAFGGVIILSGATKSLREKRDIEALAAAQVGVSRLVDRITVR